MTDGILSTYVVSTTTCGTCFTSSSTVEKHNIIYLPLGNSITLSLENILQT